MSTMVYGRTAQSHNLHLYIFLSKNTAYMKKSFLSFVAVIVGFFVSLELSAFKLTVSPEPGEVESLSSLTFYHETSGNQLYDSGNYAKLIKASISAISLLAKASFTENSLKKHSANPSPKQAPTM